MKRLFNSNMTSDRAHTAFLIELFWLKKDYNAVMSEIQQRESENGDGTVWLTEDELPLTYLELFKERAAGRKVDVLCLYEFLPHYGEIVGGELRLEDNHIVCVLEPDGEILHDVGYGDLWIAFRTGQEVS